MRNRSAFLIGGDHLLDRGLQPGNLLVEKGSVVLQTASPSPSTSPATCFSMVRVSTCLSRVTRRSSSD